MRWKNRNPELQLQAKEQKCLFLTVFNCFRKPTSQHRNSCYLPTVCRALKTTHKVNETLAQGAVRSRLPTPTAVLEQEPSHALPSGQRDTRGDTRTAPASASAPGSAPLPVPARPPLPTTAGKRQRRARPARELPRDGAPGRGARTPATLGRNAPRQRSGSAATGSTQSHRDPT